MSTGAGNAQKFYSNGLPEGRLTVVLPAYHTGRMLRATLASLANQTLSDYTLLISLDHHAKDSSGTLDILQRWLKGFKARARVEIFTQHRQLGWVENINFLFDLVRTRYVCILPHDDLLLPEYLQQLYTAQLTHPTASVTYSDLRYIGRLPLMPGNPGKLSWIHWRDQLVRWTAWGKNPHLGVQESISGEQEERVRNMLLFHYNSASFRGLLDRDTLGPHLYLDTCGPRHFAADTTWMLKKALAGPLIRVPQVLYLKRYHPKNTHLAWMNGTHEELRELWLIHCRDCLAILYKSAGERPLRLREIRWLYERLFQHRKPFWVGRFFLPDTKSLRRAWARQLFSPQPLKKDQASFLRV